MALYLNNLDLNGNQLIKATVHPLGTAPATAQEGQIYYDTGDNVVYVNTSTTPSSPSWKSMGGDITGVSFTTDDSTTISDTSGDAAFTITGGAGITTSSTGSTITIVTSNDQDTTGNAATATKLASAVNIGGVSFDGSASITLVSGSIPNNAANTSGNAATVTTNANLTGHVTSNGNAAVLGSFTVAQLSTALSDANISGNNTGDQTNISGNAATVTTNANLTGHITSSGNAAVLGSFTTAQLNAAISDGTINSQTLPTDFVSAANGGTFSSGVSFGDNNISHVGIISLDKVEADGTTITIGDQQSKSIIIGKTHPSGTTNGTSVSVEQDLTIKGKLVVQGDVETSTTSNTVIKDAIIQITGAASNTANTSDIGFVFDRGSSGNVAIAWDEGANPGAFKFIATGDTASSADIGMTSGGGEGNDENTSGGASPAGYQTIYAGKIRAVGSVGTAGFYGDGANITGISGSNISSGTVAANRIANLAASKINSGTFANAQISSGSVTQHVGSIDHDSLLNYASNEHFTQANITTVGTIGTGVWQGSAISTTYLSGQSGTNTGDETKARINALDITELGTISSGVWQGSVIASAYLDSDTAHVTQTQTLTNKTLTSPVLNTGVSGTAIKDEDDMTSNSATHLATQQSIKAYVDAQGSSSSNTGGRQAFVLGHDTSGVVGNTGSANGNNVFTITHGMGSSRNYGVEVIRNGNNSGGGETVIVDVTRPSDTTIVITFAAAVTALDYTALVCKY